MSSQRRRSWSSSVKDRESANRQEAVTSGILFYSESSIESIVRYKGIQKLLSTRFWFHLTLNLRTLFSKRLVSITVNSLVLRRFNIESCFHQEDSSGHAIRSELTNIHPCHTFESERFRPQGRVKLLTKSFSAVTQAVKLFMLQGRRYTLSEDRIR